MVRACSTTCRHPTPPRSSTCLGVFPWDAPAPDSFLSLIFIGILPIFLGISMFFQMRLNPAPTEPIQQAVMTWMPWMFMFMLGWFASGLVLYWIANNTITFIQQYSIMTMHGSRPDLLGNLGVKKEEELADGMAAGAYLPPSIKAHGREGLDAVDLTEGRCLPMDRHWAVAHDAAMLMPGWNPCTNFTRGAKTSALQAINAAWDGGAPDADPS